MERRGGPDHRARPDLRCRRLFCQHPAARPRHEDRLAAPHRVGRGRCMAISSSIHTSLDPWEAAGQARASGAALQPLAAIIMAAHVLSHVPRPPVVCGTARWIQSAWCHRGSRGSGSTVASEPPRSALEGRRGATWEEAGGRAWAGSGVTADASGIALDLGEPSAPSGHCTWSAIDHVYVKHPDPPRWIHVVLALVVGIPVVTWLVSGDHPGRS